MSQFGIPYNFQASHLVNATPKKMEESPHDSNPVAGAAVGSARLDISRIPYATHNTSCPSPRDVSSHLKSSYYFSEGESVYDDIFYRKQHTQWTKSYHK